MKAYPPLMVIDSSVAAKWILREEGREQSLRLLDAYESGQLTLIAPSLLIAEVASVLSKRRRRKELTPAQAREAFRLFGVHSPVLVDMQEQMDSAFELSLIHQLTVYDCLYLALAIGRGCELITADQKFHRATARAYPFVRLLE